ncbi:WD40 repeat domain-containing protein [Phanerochaete sordida]|uniref:WD40 repeat domain-containing protein n=1 Tax=Phanerochaete sordida TaxID=48140 RepID=A0A9P3GJC9_9APHY|nr:WD40 repeat domain-containing protein [Phanerochaete sordida]
MTQSTVLQYEAPWPVYALDWCKSPAPGHQHRPRSSFRLGLGSLTDDYRNRIAIVGLQDERVLVEDDYAADFGDSYYPDFVTLVEAHHGYPATSLQWQPASANTFPWSEKPAQTELLATTGDALRVWEYASDQSSGGSGGGGYVGKAQSSPQAGGHRLTLRAALSGQSKVQNHSTGAPLTNFSWNEKSPNLIVTASIDTTCTVWNIDKSTAITQLIAHDREVYDVAWLPQSTDIFVSVGADGSLRAFDLRSLEHSTILYETPPPKSAPPASSNGGSTPGSPGTSARPHTSPLLRIAFNPADSNYMATFHQDGRDVQILDMRSPGQPVMELHAHQAPINALAWSAGGGTEPPLLATASDDCQLLLWDLAGQASASPAPRSGHTHGPGSTAGLSASPRPETKKRIVQDPVMAYTGPSEIVNAAWSPRIAGLSNHVAPGEWVAIAMGKSIRALKV